jgi:hypothetical protein
MRGQTLLCFFLALVKCTRIYFSGAKDAPCLLAHSKHRSCTVCGVLQFSSVDLPKAGAFISSTNIVHKTGSRSWKGWGAADFNQVGVVEEEEDGRQW